MRMFIAAAVAVGLMLGTSPALAKKRGPGKPTPNRVADQCKDLQGDKAEGCRVIGTYLDLWKQQKWSDLKKLQHPKTQEKIATVKKNIGEEAHAMAPWYWARDTYILHDYKVESVEMSAVGTVTVNTAESSYRVEEDGFAEEEHASYLAGKHKGKWYVVDRRGGGGGFSKAGIEIGMKGYFDEPAPAPAAEAEVEEKAPAPQPEQTEKAAEAL
jgi:hypothetical protein